jgi:sulfate adenylyltransferase subunit 2
MSHLKSLEDRSIFILREAYANFRDLAMLWSIGKDSTVLLWLAKKAFFGHVPFPLIHVDTKFKIPEMITYRDRLAKEWGLRLLAGTNERAISENRSFPAGTLTRIDCCRTLKTEALKQTLDGTGPRYLLDLKSGHWIPDESKTAFTAVIAGIRADEEGSRSKERVFSPRDRSNKWDVALQPPEFWNQYNTEFAPGTHVRIHPLLDWTELNIWEYIEAENIPTVDLYYANEQGFRYRSLGCYPCTKPIQSPSKNPSEIIQELRVGTLKNIAERSGRAQDQDDGGGLESLRLGGYM